MCLRPTPGFHSRRVDRLPATIFHRLLELPVPVRILLGRGHFPDPPALSIVVGRKNHYGSRSERGTQVAAILYSLIESAKLCEINPHAYLESAIQAALRGTELPLPHEVR